MVKQSARNPHLQLILLGLVFLFYNYYEVALTINRASLYYDTRNAGYLYFLFALTPFTFSSLFRPVGGRITSWWQKKSNNYIFPQLFLIYSILGLIDTLLIPHLGNPIVAYSILGTRIVQGMLIGGIIPQYLIYYYEKSHSLKQRIHYSSGSFIAISIAVILSELIFHFIPPNFICSLNIAIDLTFILIACAIFRYKNISNNFLIDNIPVTQSLPFFTVLKENYPSIVRFALFITFMASIDSFFMTVMPFYMIHYLHYNPTDIFLALIFIVFAGLWGYFCGGYFHAVIGKRVHITLGLVLKVILFFLFRMYVEHDIFMIVVLGSICIFFQGLMAAKISLILNSIFPARSRLDAISLTYNISWGLMFGFSGFIILSLVNHFHNLYLPSLAIMFFSYLSIISLWFTPEKDFYRYLESN